MQNMHYYKPIFIVSGNPTEKRKGWTKACIYDERENATDGWMLNERDVVCKQPFFLPPFSLHERPDLPIERKERKNNAVYFASLGSRSGRGK